jgi:hypothetical protein
MAQDCATAPAAVVGANPFDTTSSTVSFAMPAGGGCGSVHTIYKANFFTFTATVDGAHTFSLCGASTWDTRIAVLASCDPAAGVLGCNDDFCSLQSQTIPNLVAGTTYKVVVGGYGAANGGLGTLTISAPNGGGGGGGGGCDEASSLTLGANSFTNTPTGTVLNMAGYCDPGTFGDDSIYNTNYYTFTPKVSGSYSFSTCNSATWDTRLAVMTTCNDATTVIACNDDGAGCANFSSLIPSVALTAGTTYSVAIGGYNAATPVLGGTITVAEAGGGGGGSNCEEAAEIFEGPNNFATVAGQGNLDLTGICDHGPAGDDIVYNVAYFRFTPTQSGVWSATTCGTAPFDTKIAVLGSCDPSSVIGCNDDGPGCTGFTSILEFEATQGVEVVVAVGGWAAGNAGAGTISMVFGSVTVGCGDPKAGDCCTANGTPACSDETCCDLVCASDAFCCDTEWDQICADTAAALCVSCGAGDCKVPPGEVAEAEACGEDLNGGCNGGAVEFVSVGDTIGGTFWADADTRDTDWYQIDLTEGTEVTLTIWSNLPCFAAFVDTACGGIIGGVITEGDCPETLSVCLAAGSYYVVALPQTFSGFPCGGLIANDYTLAISGVPCDAAPPANDNCADAAVAIEGANPFDNTFATTEYTAATCGFNGVAFSKDVFFTFTATQTGDYEVSTCAGAAPFDTGIEIWSSCPDAGGSLIACNDDGTGCANFSSKLNFAAVTGTTYTIRVGGWNGATGATDMIITFIGDAPSCGDAGTGDCCIANGTPFCEDAECCTLICAADAFCCDQQWDQVCADAAAVGCTSCGGSGPPANDECENAIALNVGVTPFSTVLATGTTVACTKFGNPNINNDIWYVYTADGEGLCTIATCNDASFDTKIAIFEGSCTGPIVGCNDDGTGCANFTSTATFSATCGTVYYVSVGAYTAGVTGSGNLTVTQEGKCSSNCPSDLNGDGVTNALDLAALLGAWGGAGADINGDGTTNALDLAALLGGWGTCP